MAAIRVPRADCYYDDRDSYAKGLIRDVEYPTRFLTPFWRRFLLALATASVLVLAVLRQVSVVSLTSIALLTLIFYIMFSSMTGDNMAGSLPYATYPPPPHLGLDGIALVNRVA